ncbi:ubiquitin-conjugating enzyme [Ceratobasidium sp. AG-Ba]|nr:ubiquitin-conjugating enzyme [Ceratobasidium sp. AG-Ba]
MATRSSHNKNNSAVKRILQEAKELQNDPSHEYSAGPLEAGVIVIVYHEWHATLRGAPDTEFEGGLYHCRILLPAEYPFRPPSIMVLTPNGRFELNKKICISFTNYHEELWQPAWGVRTAIIGLQGFFPHKGEAAVGVGALEYPISERKRLAALSRGWYCPDCQQTNLECLPDPPAPAETSPSTPLEAGQAEGEPKEPEATEEPAEAEIELARPVLVATTNTNSSESTERPAQLTPTPTTTADPPTTVDAPRPAPGGAPSPTSPTFVNATAATTTLRPTPTTRPRRSSRPPILLDLAIISLVSIFIAIVVRRVL